MRALLDPTDLAPAAAAAEVRRRLGRAPRWRLLLAACPADARTDVAVACAWDLGIRTRIDAQADAGLRARELSAWIGEARAAVAGEAGTLVGRALGVLSARRRLAPAELLGPLEERRRVEHVSAFETRDVLLEHARRIAHPPARVLLACLDRRDERDRLRAESLALAVWLTRRQVAFTRDLRAGRLYLPVDALTAQGADLQGVLRGESSPELCRAREAMVALTRGFYVKGWPLTAELGPWRGRVLAFLLRWHAADLAGLEHRRFDPARGEPAAGLLRFGACFAGALAGTGAPPL